MNTRRGILKGLGGLVAGLVGVKALAGDSERGVARRVPETPVEAVGGHVRVDSLPAGNGGAFVGIALGSSVIGSDGHRRIWVQSAGDVSKDSAVYHDS